MLDVDQRCTQTSRATVGTCTCPTRTHALVVSLRRKNSMRCCLHQISKQRVETETGNTNKVEATAKSAEEELQQREAELK